MAVRKVILYIATSLDGYIAQPDDDLSFLEAVAKEGEDYGYVDFLASIDTVIVGRRTYDWVMEQVEEFPHAHLDTYVITRTPRPSIGKTNFYTGDLTTLIAGLKKEPGKNIYCDGGGGLVHELLQHQLIDEFIISVIPVIIGGGIPLFKAGRPLLNLECSGVKHFNTGLVQLHYRTSEGEKT